MHECSPASVGFDAGRLARIDDVFQRDVEQGRIAGAVVLLARHGSIAWHRAFGFEDDGVRRPMQPDSVFRLAALTRPVFAVGVLSLAEEGRLLLSDPVQQYLPELGALRVGIEGDDGSITCVQPHRPVTLLDLLRHTSGLTYGIFGDSPIKRLYRERPLLVPGQTNAELVGKLAGLPLRCQPGTAFEYGMSTDVLGRVVEVVTGMDLDDFLEERVTGPLAMRDTRFRMTRAHREHIALPRRADGAPPGVLFDYDLDNPPRWCSAGAGLLSTAPDYARFCQMLLEGGSLDGNRVLARKTVDLMLADHIPPGAGRGSSTAGLGINAPLPELGQSYGLCVGMRTAPGLSSVPGSVGDFFWGGALGTYFWADPRERLVGVLMLQENDLATRAWYRSFLRHAAYAALTD